MSNLSNDFALNSAVGQNIALHASPNCHLKCCLPGPSDLIHFQNFFEHNMTFFVCFFNNESVMLWLLIAVLSVVYRCMVICDDCVCVEGFTFKVMRTRTVHCYYL